MRHALLALAAACAHPRFEPVATPMPRVSIERIELTWSNVYLVRDGDALALVDTGSPVDRDALERALADRGVDLHCASPAGGAVRPGKAGPCDPHAIRAVVVTHAHADHAGLARWLQQRGAKIVLGAADARMAAAGANDPLPATGLVAGWLAPVFMFAFEPFVPDLAVDRELDLGALGLPDVRVVPVPGHTPGSLAVVLDQRCAAPGGAAARSGKAGPCDRVAIAGDLMKGGIFAKYFVTVPSEHYYQTDPARDHDAVRALLERGVTTFYLGHGGPVARDDVAAWVADADDPHSPHATTFELGATGQLARGGGDDGAGGLLRVRYGIGRPLGYFGGVDVAAGSLDGAYASFDAHVLGLAVRDRTGAFVAVTAGAGVGGLRGIAATHAVVELSGELPLGPVRLVARTAAGWRLGGARYADSTLPVDEFTALAGVRLGRDRPWGRVVAGRGPYLAGTYQHFGAASWLGAVIGIELAAGD